MTPINPAGEERLRVWCGELLLSPRDQHSCPESSPEVVDGFLKRHGVGRLLDHDPAARAVTRRGRPSGTDMRQAVAVELARQHEFASVMPRLQRRISRPPLVYKGQALAHTLYPKPWLRPRGDVDILVQHPDLAPLTTELASLGYEKVLSTGGDLIMTQSAMRRRVNGVDHTWDIHWEISNRPAFNGAVTWQKLRPSAIEIRAGGLPFLAPSHADSLLIACLHLVGHHADEPRMIWLYDIHLLASALDHAGRRQFLDKAAAAAPVCGACLDALALTQRYLPAECTDTLLKALGAAPRSCGRTGRNYFDRLLGDAKALSREDRLRFMRQHLFPPRSYMMQRFAIRHRWQLPYWYAVRIARAIPKLFKRR